MHEKHIITAECFQYFEKNRLNKINNFIMLNLKAAGKYFTPDNSR